MTRLTTLRDTARGMGAVLLVIGLIVLALLLLVVGSAIAGQIGVKRAQAKYGFTDAEADRWSHLIVEIGGDYARLGVWPPPGMTKREAKRMIKQAAADQILEGRESTGAVVPADA